MYYIIFTRLERLFWRSMEQLNWDALAQMLVRELQKAKREMDFFRIAQLKWMAFLYLEKDMPKDNKSVDMVKHIAYLDILNKDFIIGAVNEVLNWWKKQNG